MMAAPVRMRDFTAGLTIIGAAANLSVRTACGTSRSYGVSYRTPPPPIDAAEDFDPFYRADMFMNEDWDQ